MSGFAPIVLRDAAILGACLFAWSSVGSLPVGLGIGLAIVVGLVLGFLAHEWTHLAGALAAGSRVHPNPPSRPQLFRFETSENSRIAFLSMGWGGNLGPWLVVLWAIVPFLAAYSPGGGSVEAAPPVASALLATTLAGVLFVNLTAVPLLIHAARTGEVSFAPSGTRFALAGLLGIAGGITAVQLLAR